MVCLLCPEWCIKTKTLFTAFYADDGLLFFDEDSGNVTFNANQKHNFVADLEKIYLNNNFDEDKPDTIIYVRLLDWNSKLKKLKALKNVKVKN